MASDWEKNSKEKVIAECIHLGRFPFSFSMPICGHFSSMSRTWVISFLLEKARKRENRKANKEMN